VKDWHHTYPTIPATFSLVGWCFLFLTRIDSLGVVAHPLLAQFEQRAWMQRLELED